MPSSFPGMDPYLEGRYWSTLHSQLVPEFARQLSPIVRPQYRALTEQWYFLSTLEEPRAAVRPDVSVELVREAVAAYEATTIAPPTHTLRTIIPVRRRQVSVEIRDVRELRLVAVVELLSPANKQGEGYDHYVRRRSRLLQRGVNLVEIDLLHEGRRIPIQGVLPDEPYFAFVTHAEAPTKTYAWAIALADTLPVVPVPLTPSDEPAPLDLQRAVTTVYDIVGYDGLLDYALRPSVQIPDTESAWVRQRLASQGVDTRRWEADEPAM